jgi:hypothetical protein
LERKKNCKKSKCKEILIFTALLSVLTYYGKMEIYILSTLLYALQTVLNNNEL